VVPAGAAHVAFPAASREVVERFFVEAVKAGGKVHGVPELRDVASGYFSAAVLDFDGNSVEAVFREGVVGGGSVVGGSSGGRVRSGTSGASKGRSVVSAAASGTSGGLMVAKSRVHVAVEDEEKPAVKPSHDALEMLLNQARSTADVARQLVESVRPHLLGGGSGSGSGGGETKSKSREVVHNKDAFAKSGDSGNAVVGTLLGVAAGAGLVYALAQSRKGSPEGEKGWDDDDPRGGGGKRPGVPRSATAPETPVEGKMSSHGHGYGRSYVSGSKSTAAHAKGVGLGGAYDYRAIEAPTHHIAMHDRERDDVSTVRARRRSLDSGIGVSASPSPPKSTTSGRGSGKGLKMIEAPPSAYRAPTAVTLATQSRSRSKAREEGDAHAAGSKTSRRSRSESRSESKHERGRSGSRSRGHGRHDSGISMLDGKRSEISGYETVLHVQTSQSFRQKGNGKGDGGSPPSRAWGEHKMMGLPNESVSTGLGRKAEKDTHRKKRSSSRSHASNASRATATTAIRDGGKERKPESYPLPPSRAATWTGSGTGGRNDRDGAESFVSARSGWQKNGTVIGKMRDVKNLRVKKGEVRPDESVSQVG
jgi:hypothetical protein